MISRERDRQVSKYVGKKKIGKKLGKRREK